MALDNQLVEMLGRNRLTDELLRAELEVARPLRDRGVDLIVYADLDSKVRNFIARPIQMKAASAQSFGINKKYEKFPNLLMVYTWHLNGVDVPITFAMSYAEALRVADQMGYTKTPSWKNKGSYDTTRPSKRLQELLEPYRMTSARWWDKITKAK